MDTPPSIPLALPSLLLSAGQGECRAGNIPGAAHRARVATATPAERVPSRNQTSPWRWVSTLPRIISCPHESPIPVFVTSRLVAAPLPALGRSAVSSEPLEVQAMLDAASASAREAELAKLEAETITTRTGSLTPAQRCTDRVGRSRRDQFVAHNAATPHSRRTPPGRERAPGRAARADRGAAASPGRRRGAGRHAGPVLRDIRMVR